jgi:hypothetical protein
MTRNFTRPALLAAATIGFAAFFTTQPAANAACFEGAVGCTDTAAIPVAALQELSCDSLWTVRNMIFDENGYCFKTAKAKSIFSNDGCSHTTMASMPLNSYETKNIALVQAVEKQKACH